MPTFTVLCRVDAYVDYTATVEADDAEEAAWWRRRTPTTTPGRNAAWRSSTPGAM